MCACTFLCGGKGGGGGYVTLTRTFFSYLAYIYFQSEISDGEEWEQLLSVTRTTKTLGKIRECLACCMIKKQKCIEHQFIAW